MSTTKSLKCPGCGGLMNPATEYVEIAGLPIMTTRPVGDSLDPAQSAPTAGHLYDCPACPCTVDVPILASIEWTA